MFRKLLVLAFGGVLIATPLAVTPGSLSAEERGEVKIAATALGVPGAPAYGVPGALAYGGAQGPAALGVPPRGSRVPRLRRAGSPAYGSGSPRLRRAGSAARRAGSAAYGVQGAPAYGVQGAPAYGFSGYPMWGVQGAPAYGVQGAPAYGVVVWIPAVVGGATGAVDAASVWRDRGAAAGLVHGRADQLCRDCRGERPGRPEGRRDRKHGNRLPGDQRHRRQSSCRRRARGQLNPQDGAARPAPSPTRDERYWLLPRGRSGDRCAS